MKVNRKLQKYIEEAVFPRYETNDEAHQIEHSKYVIDRCFKLNKKANADVDMLYVIAAYHDIGYSIDYKNHEKVSAQMMYDDATLKKFFNEEQRLTMKEAIEDHRASLDGEPRNIYGKLLSSADRNVDVDESLKRIYLYNITHMEQQSREKTVEECYNHTLKKFGDDGYVKFFLEDEVYDKYLKEMRELLKDKEKFIERLEKIISNTK